MRCVVLGGGGFIGSNLAARLVADGHDVTAVDVDFPTWRTPPCTTRVADLTDPTTAISAVAGFEWVFHLAADMGGVGYFHSNADLGAAMLNGRITLNVLAAIRPGQRLFYSSSACCYPIEMQMGTHAPKLSEDWIGFGTPDALYGAEKLHGLRLCSKVTDARVGVFHTIYGPLQEHDGRRMKFPAAVAQKARQARQTGTLELWGDGRQKRSYLYVDDAVDRIVQVMESDRYDGPVNVGASGAVTCLEVARMALEIAGVPDAEITTNPAEPSGVTARDCDNTKFNRTYGATPETSVRDGIAGFVGWLDSIDPPTTATRTPPRNAMMPKPERR
jgi:nucleoside-diphosphate-sugar epimerase